MRLRLLIPPLSNPDSRPPDLKTGVPQYGVGPTSRWKRSSTL